MGSLLPKNHERWDVGDKEPQTTTGLGGDCAAGGGSEVEAGVNLAVIVGAGRVEAVAEVEGFG